MPISIEFEYRSENDFKKFINHLQTWEIESFMDLIFIKHDQYIANYEATARQRSKAYHYWFELIQYCLLKCRDQYIVETAGSWFPIFHENDENNKEWILKEMVANMNTQTRFDFGIYLTKYISYHWDGESKFPKEYLNFLKNDLEIEWDIVGDE